MLLSFFISNFYNYYGVWICNFFQFSFFFFLSLTFLHFNFTLSYLSLSARLDITWKLFSYFFFFFFLEEFWENIIVDLNLTVTLHLGLVNIHPLVFYSFLFSIFCCIFNFSWEVRLGMPLLFVLGGVALVLGMFWGVFSFTWGFFWVNDSIEWVLLGLTLLYLSLIHTYYFTSQTNLVKFVFLFSLGCLFLIRFNIFWTRHSFFNELSVLYFNIYIYSYFLGYLSILFYCIGSYLVSLLTLLGTYPLYLFLSYLHLYRYVFFLSIWCFFLHFYSLVFIYCWGFNFSYYYSLTLAFLKTYVLTLGFYSSSYSLFVYDLYLTYIVNSFSYLGVFFGYSIFSFLFLYLTIPAILNYSFIFLGILYYGESILKLKQSYKY